MNTKLNHVENWPKLASESKWSASLLAKKCVVSMRTLERHFLKKMGMNPKEWLSEQRHLRAIELLKNGSSVKEAAACIGYKRATHFTRAFKKHWRRLPSDEIKSVR